MIYFHYNFQCSNNKCVIKCGINFNLVHFTDVDNVEAKFDLAMRSNKWEGEDEDEDVKV